MSESEKWNVSSEDRSKWLRNALVFLAPVALIYLTEVQKALGDGFSWSDFELTLFAKGAFSLYFVNVLTDFFRKWSAGPVE